MNFRISENRQNIVGQMKANNTIPWIEKYRPKLLNDVVQNDDLLNLFKNTIKTKNIPHMLLYGPPGTGKTSSILAIGRELFREYFSERIIEFNASDDRGISAVRDKITYEAKKYVSEIITEDNVVIPPYKIIILDEADSMTDEAQDALRVVIEEYSKVTRFCFICNYISKITDAIKSRCSHIYFKKIPDECMITKLSDISVRENMELSAKIIKKIIQISNGDMRKAVVILQNLKYLTELKKFYKKPFDKMTIKELTGVCAVSICQNDPVKISNSITIEDIYDMSANINPLVAENAINSIINCKNIIQVRDICRDLMATGYPIDNIILKLNEIIKCSELFNDISRAKIFVHSVSILAKIKECSIEYIHFLDYLVHIYNVLRL